MYFLGGNKYQQVLSTYSFTYNEERLFSILSNLETNLLRINLSKCTVIQRVSDNPQHLAQVVYSTHNLPFCRNTVVGITV